MHRRRIAANLTQADLSARSGVPLRTIQRIDQGQLRRRPSLEHLSNLAAAFGCEVTELIEPEWLAWVPVERGPQAPPLPLKLPAAVARTQAERDVKVLERIERAWIERGDPLPYQWHEYVGLLRKRVRELR